MFGQNLQKFLVDSALHRSLIDPHFKIVLMTLTPLGSPNVRSNIDPDHYASVMASWIHARLIASFFGRELVLRE